MAQTVELSVGPVKVKIKSEGDRIAAAIEKGRQFEPGTLNLWASFCEAGVTVLDIGAYTGVFTIGARLLGARVIAFEPMPSNRVRLRENCLLNGVVDEINSEAIADRCGAGELHYNPIPYTSGASLVRRKGPAWPVDLLTIDSLKLTSVCAIKVDVERAEPAVIAGARETLKRLRPILILEVLGDSEGEKVMAAIDGLGYRHDTTIDRRNWIMLP